MTDTTDPNAATQHDAHAIDPQVLEVMRCPLTRSRLTQRGDELVAEVGGLRYPIRDGIPILLIDEAALPEGISSLDDFKQKFADDIPE